MNWDETLCHIGLFYIISIVFIHSCEILIFTPQNNMQNETDYNTTHTKHHHYEWIYTTKAIETRQDNPISISYANAVETNCLIEKMKYFDWNKRCYC